MGGGFRACFDVSCVFFRTENNEDRKGFLSLKIITIKVCTTVVVPVPGLVTGGYSTSTVRYPFCVHYLRACTSQYKYL